MPNKLIKKTSESISIETEVGPRKRRCTSCGSEDLSETVIMNYVQAWVSDQGPLWAHPKFLGEQFIGRNTQELEEIAITHFLCLDCGNIQMAVDPERYKASWIPREEVHVEKPLKEARLLRKESNPAHDVHIYHTKNHADALEQYLINPLQKEGVSVKYKEFAWHSRKELDEWNSCVNYSGSLPIVGCRMAIFVVSPDLIAILDKAQAKFQNVITTQAQAMFGSSQPLLPILYNVSKDELIARGHLEENMVIRHMLDHEADEVAKEISDLLADGAGGG